jgi:hypothetical protein
VLIESMHNYGVISVSVFKGNIDNVNWGSIFVKPFGTSREIFVPEISSWNIVHYAPERRFVGM